MGLEPTTPCLKGRCSNRLSYGPVNDGREINSLYYLYFGSKVNLAFVLAVFAAGLGALEPED